MQSAQARMQLLHTNRFTENPLLLLLLSKQGFNLVIILTPAVPTVRLAHHVSLMQPEMMESCRNHHLLLWELSACTMPP